jgi:regulatory protein
MPPQSLKSLRSRSTEPLAPEQLYQYALRLLTGRDYTVARLRQKLTARAENAEAVEALLERLQRDGWVNDRRYAERFAGLAVESGRFYGARLRVEMRRRGFAPELVTEVLAPLLAESDEGAETRAALERRFPGFSAQAASDKEKRRVVGFLQRRGFGLGAIMRALRAEECCY